MRMIDADKIINDLEAMRTQFDAIALDGLIRGIAEQPTIEAEPVRHGKWKFDAITSQDYVSGEYDEIFYLECPFCGRREYDLDLFACLDDDFHKVISDYPYCHCGAKMDLEG